MMNAAVLPAKADDGQGAPFSLTIETPAALSNTHEIQLLRAAMARQPRSIVIREKLAFLLLITDRFDEAIVLFEALAIDSPGFSTLVLLANARLSLETPDDDRRAEAAARNALDFAVTPHQRARALAVLGKSLARQGRSGEARETLLAALAADPHNADACKRLIAIDFEKNDMAATLAVIDDLLAKGVAHPRLLVAQALALARMGNVGAARAAVGLERFLYREILAPPPGWASIADFNAAIQAELSRHPDIRYDRYGSASSKTWRIDQPLTASATIIPQLQAAIQAVVLDYVGTLASHGDAPWVRARPAKALLHNWCVMTDADGFEEWHVHQHGWLSGVYYVDVPPVVAEGDGRGGCIAFGLPDDLVGADMAAAYGEQLVRPENGLLMLFPSHTYHRTFAHGSDHRRICLAFDIKPLD